MTEFVHIEGMGLQGCLLAHRLHMYGVPFCWSDNDAQHTAWKASTGAIYPATSTKFGPDEECWKVWQAWYEAGHFLPSHLEKSAGMVFITKQPPHQGKYPSRTLEGSLKLGQLPSFHLNSQAFVLDTREKFAHRRETEKTTGSADLKIIAHGWGDRLSFAYWGWTRLVGLDYPDYYGTEGKRPAFYFRPHKFLMAYAYPVPGTPYWYAGSSIIKQKLGAFKELDAEAHYQRWKTSFERLAEGKVLVTDDSHPPLQGWRPAAAQEDTSWARRRGRVVTLRPLWNNGIRHFPRQWAGVAEILGLIP